MQESRRKTRELKRPVSWYITWIVIDLVAIAIIIGFILSLPIWRLKNIEVRGNDFVPAEKIVSIAKIPAGENIFMVDLDEAESRFSDIAQIKETRIQRKLPATIIIKVQERKPFAIAVIGGVPALVDEGGYIIAKQNLGSSIYKLQIAQLPVIRGINRKTVEGGRRIDPADAIFMKDTLTLLSNFLDPSTIQIELMNKEDIIIYVEDILKVKIGEPKDMENKIRTMQALLDSIKGKWNRVAYIDVRVPDSPVIKFK